VRFLTTALDIIGAAALVACAFFVWPPAALAVGGLLLLAASWRLTTEGRAE